MRNSFIYNLLIVTCLVVLSGCGQKGPLFIPEDPEALAAEQAAAEAQAAEDAQALSDEETQKEKKQTAE